MALTEGHNLRGTMKPAKHIGPSVTIEPRKPMTRLTVYEANATPPTPVSLHHSAPLCCPRPTGQTLWGGRCQRHLVRVQVLDVVARHHCIHRARGYRRHVGHGAHHIGLYSRVNVQAQRGPALGRPGKTMRSTLWAAAHVQDRFQRAYQVADTVNSWSISNCCALVLWL